MKSSPLGPKLPDEKPKPLSREKRLETPTLELGGETETRVENRDGKECKIHVYPEVATKHDHKHVVSSEQAADTASPVEAPVGASALPEAVQNEPCISPTEQLKALGKTPKPKGRPSKTKKAEHAEPKAKSTAKAKARSSKAARGKRKAEGDNEEGEDQHTEEVQHEEQEDKGTVNGEEHEETSDKATSSKSPGKVTRKARSKRSTKKGKKGNKVKAEGVKGGKAEESCKASSSKRKQNTTKKDDAKVPVPKDEAAEERAPRIANKARAKAKAKAKAAAQSKSGTKNDNSKEITPEQKAKKQLLSRKSSASHKARKAARDAGKTEEEAKAAAAKATWQHETCHTPLSWKHIRLYAHLDLCKQLVYWFVLILVFVCIILYVCMRIRYFLAVCYVRVCFFRAFASSQAYAETLWGPWLRTSGLKGFIQKAFLSDPNSELSILPSKETTRVTRRKLLLAFWGSIWGFCDGFRGHVSR